MARLVLANCPRCYSRVEVDPLAENWPQHKDPGKSKWCHESGEPMPNEKGEALKVDGVPTVTIPDEILERSDAVHDLVQVGYVGRDVHVYFPPLDGAECIFGRNIPDDGALVIARLGKGFLAPKVTILVEYPKMPTFSSPEEADEWMERML